MKLYGAIEAGGTKFNCAVFDEHRTLINTVRLPTTSPDDTLSRVIDFFQTHQNQDIELSAIGIASFGPLDLNFQSPTYGYITSTPKPFWANTDLFGPLAGALKCKVAFDTDVNGAALAEYNWGAGQGCDSLIYITVGTGIGGGVVVHGKPLHGLIHPEIGHMLLPRIGGVQGQCPFHENCAEGYGSGRAIEGMWGQPAQTLAPDHPAWDRQALVLAQLCHNLMMSFSPQKIILGGGVMAQSHLHEKVINNTESSLNGYLTLPANISLSDVIVQPALGDLSGLYGAFALAKNLSPP